MELGAKSMEHGAKSMAHGAKSMAHGAKSMAHGAKSMAHGEVIIVSLHYSIIPCFQLTIDSWQYRPEHLNTRTLEKAGWQWAIGSWQKANLQT